MNDSKIDKGSCNKTRLMNRLIGNSSRFTQELNRRMQSELSLSLAKYEVLLVIGRAPDGEITMSNLSRELLVSNANMTGMSTRLQADGLVDKKTLPSDRRIFSVALTEKGKKILEKADEKHGIWIRELLSSVETDEINFMNNFLDKMDKQSDYF